MGHPLTPLHCTRTHTTLPGKLLKTNITLLGCFGFFTMFLAQWLNWYNFSVYESRFSANDAAHRVGLRLSWISWLSWGGVAPTAKTRCVPAAPAGVQVAAVSGSAMCRHACWRLAVDEQVQAWLCHRLPCGETGHHAAVSGSHHKPGRGVGVEASPHINSHLAVSDTARSSSVPTRGASEHGGLFEYDHEHCVWLCRPCTLCNTLPTPRPLSPHTHTHRASSSDPYHPQLPTSPPCG